MARYLVVGGARPGIGQATTSRLLAQGHTVTVTCETELLEDVADFVSGLPGASVLTYDTTTGVRSIIDSLESVSDVDAVVVAEMFFYMEQIGKFDEQQWDRSLLVNLTLPKIVGYLESTKWISCLSVVMVTSSEANTGSFGAHAYAACKAATHNLVRSLANTSPRKCRYNAVAPGWIGGVMDTDTVFEMSRAVTPLGRLGTPDEVASVIAWLSSEDASFINGATIIADGGYTGVDTISKFEYDSEFGSPR